MIRPGASERTLSSTFARCALAIESKEQNTAMKVSAKTKCCPNRALERAAGRYPDFRDCLFPVKTIRENTRSRTDFVRALSCDFVSRSCLSREHTRNQSKTLRAAAIGS